MIPKKITLSSWSMIVAGLAIVLGVVLSSNLLWVSSITTVVIVRHAEKEDDALKPKPDKEIELSAAGKERAQALSHVLEDLGIQVVFATKHLRTQQTADPLVTELGADPILIEKDNVDALVHAILSDHRGKTILVVHHSDKIPEILTGLGIPSSISALQGFDHMFIVQRHEATIKKRVLGYQLNYGDPSP